MSHQLHPLQKRSLLDRKLLSSAVTPTFCPLSAPGDRWSIFCPCGLAYSGHFIEMKSHDVWRLCLASPPLHGFCTVRVTVSQSSSASFPGASITGMWGYRVQLQHACMWEELCGSRCTCVCMCMWRQRTTSSGAAHFAFVRQDLSRLLELAGKRS